MSATGPPELAANGWRGSWFYYAAAVFAFGVGVLNLWVGHWPCALVSLSMAGMIACHPWIRGEWYRLGWSDGHYGKDSLSGPPKGAE